MLSLLQAVLSSYHCAVSYQGCPELCCLCSMMPWAQSTVLSLLKVLLSSYPRFVSILNVVLSTNHCVVSIQGCHLLLPQLRLCSMMPWAQSTVLSLLNGCPELISQVRLYLMLYWAQTTVLSPPKVVLISAAVCIFSPTVVQSSYNCVLCSHCSRILWSLYLFKVVLKFFQTCCPF